MCSTSKIKYPPEQRTYGILRYALNVCGCVAQVQRVFYPEAALIQVKGWYGAHGISIKRSKPGDLFGLQNPQWVEGSDTVQWFEWPQHVGMFEDPNDGKPQEEETRKAESSVSKNLKTEGL